MIDQTRDAFNQISRVLAITRYDLEQHQSINDQSLNIHGENWFRDIINFAYDENCINANFLSSNCPAIDLVDTKKKKAYQITTTRTKQKIENTMKTIKKTEFSSYELHFFFLLDKARPNQQTITYFREKYGMNIEGKLHDYSDLLKRIQNLEMCRLLELCKKYFRDTQSKYTDEIVLDLIIRHLVSTKKTITIDYDDEFGTLEVKNKMILNDINDRISNEINKGLDYQNIITSFIDDNSLIADLKNIVIDDLYKNLLINALRKYSRISELKQTSTNTLQQMAHTNKLDFNKIIMKLHNRICDEIEIKDFNTMSVGWIIIAYFFEICDIGVSREC